MQKLYDETSEEFLQQELMSANTEYEKEIIRTEYYIKLRLAAHVMIILQFLGRVSQSQLSYYNKILKRYIEHLAKTLDNVIVSS